MKSLKTIFVIGLPITLLMMMHITIKWIQMDGDGGPNLYGYPMPFMTSTWVNSFEHEIYIKGLLIDFLVYLIPVTLCTILLDKMIHHQWSRKLMPIILWVYAGLFVGLPLLTFNEFLTYKWDSEFKRNPMKKQIHMGFIPW